MKLSEFFGKSVYSEDGKRSGYIIKVYADGGIIQGFLCADDAEREFFVAADCVKSAGEKIIFKGGEARPLPSRQITLGKPAYNDYGEYLGALRDFECKNFSLKTAKIGRKNYAAGDVFCGDAVIVRTGCTALKEDVQKGGKVLFKRGDTPDEKMLLKAISAGEYIQTNLKKI